MPNLNKEQGTALCDLLNAFNKARDSRKIQVRNNDRHLSDLLDQYAKSKGTTNAVGLAPRDEALDLNFTKADYINLYKSLNHPSISNHLTDDMKALNETLLNSMKTNDFKAVDVYFDKNHGLLLSLGSTKSQPELVKIGEITKNNPKLTLKQRLDNFDNKVANALYNFFHHKEI